MDEQTIFVNQPLHIEIETGVDLTGVSTTLIKFKKPNGASDSWTASVTDEKGGIIEYDVPKDILDVAGVWKFWASLDFGDGPYPGTVFEQEIFNEGE